MFCEDFAMLFWCRRHRACFPKESITVHFNSFQSTWILVKGSWTSQLSLDNRFTGNPAVLTELSATATVWKMWNRGGVKLPLSSGLRYSLPQQELVDGLLFPHALHNQPVQINKQSATKTTGDPAGHTKTRSVSAAFLGGNKTSNPEQVSHCQQKKTKRKQLLSWVSLWKSQVAQMNFISFD